MSIIIVIFFVLICYFALFFYTSSGVIFEPNYKLYKNGDIIADRINEEKVQIKKITKNIDDTNIELLKYYK
ncbi:hypothetical protein fgpv_190 [Flamingopox virus FGPVKD09]|uniref:Uncharacterized protein n=1 Tax=Flamingopox virus FGPVKD09 TaxID=2059380 RepID=A0A2H4X2K0_9POXV|nr:hypothetical protein C1178_gp190 [Flamingopox virus FGPVKD09]AUD40284.1 hypothetical protein fgpv_190 [Flamingopox virus FGPVKD09]